MTKYVALLRGIAPTNPNMRQAKLCGVLEGLGLKNVRGVISSGNVVFESGTKDVESLEKKIEAAWPKQLGFHSTTIIRSQQQLQDLVAKDPYKDVAESPNNYFLVTFFKQPKTVSFTTPYRPDNKPYTLVAAYPKEVCSVTDLSASKTPDLMTWLEKQFGKEITSRTLLTIHRILKKMD
jgi:uncharacterized protein (DUF1697 family)